MKNQTYLILALIFLIVGIGGLVFTNIYYGSGGGFLIDNMMGSGGMMREWKMGPEGMMDDEGRDDLRNNINKSMKDMMDRMMRDYSKDSYSSEGERIYLTGENEKGEKISSNMPMSEMMSLGCAHCHGIKGRGGLLFPDGKTKSSNITWDHLKEHKPPYDEESLRKAITEGTEPDGEELSPFMPRWKMSEEDLDALISYLKTL